MMNKISESAISAIGACALSETDSLEFLIDAIGEAIPSCDAVVGIEIK